MVGHDDILMLVFTLAAFLVWLLDRLQWTFLTRDNQAVINRNRFFS